MLDLLVEGHVLLWGFITLWRFSGVLFWLVVGQRPGRGLCQEQHLHQGGQLALSC